jgi:hypothetical protein
MWSIGFVGLQSLSASNQDSTVRAAVLESLARADPHFLARLARDFAGGHPLERFEIDRERAGELINLQICRLTIKMVISSSCGSRVSSSQIGRSPAALIQHSPSA